MHRRATHGRDLSRTTIVGGAVVGSTLAAMALALGAPSAAFAAPSPAPNALTPAVQATGTPAAVPTPLPVPVSVGTLPVVGPLVAPSQVSSQPTSSPAPGSVKAQASGAKITVAPNSNLTNGQQVQVSGSGFAPNSAGGMAECNNAPNQPTDQVYGNAVPVGCTNPLQSLAATDASGSFHFTFTVKTGTIGPPASGKDSSGNDSAADSAKYPCPPTAAQQASGITCGISYGDASGNQASGDITFASSAASQSNGPAAATAAGPYGGGSATTTAGGSTAGSGSAPTAGATDSSGSAGGGVSSGGALPFTGFGIGMWRLALLGAFLAGLGASMIVLGRRPGALARRVWALRPPLARVVELTRPAASAVWARFAGRGNTAGLAGSPRHARRSGATRVLAGH